ncbi:Uncharacterised protein [Chryseobacterium indoltheticum]|uniref:Uncharacterized protein n=1 Tax=Chryseobacterium indoltheticum TaxID=254 RepID=A0A381FR60_9FLAO|nr:Uncharacterised protein [Chryseobacterium indoltheticum]
MTKKLLLSYFLMIAFFLVSCGKEYTTTSEISIKTVSLITFIFGGIIMLIVFTSKKR